jgi:NTP pyrophosphatase (non-canonical NTP hydrolase)
MDIQQLQEKIRAFRDERNWMQFHDPKSMASSICIEAAELLEHFQWKDKDEAEEYLKDHKKEVSEEIADVAMYLFEFAENLGIDLKKAIEDKLEKNAQKYPIEKAKGSSKKYNQFS